jgi:anti-sigma regulatory factor (Ser/Thr protein kinase)
MKKSNLELQNALDKELSLMKNDFYYQQIELARGSEKKIVRLDISFNPLDVLGGDSYSLRKTIDGKIVFFILDAMGKGVSASITAATSASLLNYIFDQMKRQENFEFERWIKRYVDFVKDELLENEMLAIFFGCYDKKTGFFDNASFGMPASIVQSCNGDFIKKRSNNAPINRYTDGFEIETMNVKKIKKALIYTDGLCETTLENGEFYKEKMYQDFIDSENCVDFSKRVRTNTKDRDDDILYLYIDTLQYDKGFITKKVKPNHEAIDEVLLEISEYVKKNGAKPKEFSELSLALSELLINALEHGIFGIDKNAKNRLIDKGKFDDALLKFEQKYKDKNILVNYVVKEEGGSKIFVARIEDGGAGFDTRTLRQLAISPQHFNGRGIMIVKRLLDRFYFNEKGNSITIRKYLN